MKTTKVIGTGLYVPEKVITNFDLEKMVDTTDEWIVTRTGIKERRFAADNEATSDLGAEAARRALDDAKINSSEIDMVILATATPDMMFPATACLVQHKLGIKRAAAFDLEAACSGFLYGLSIADTYIKSGVYETILVIGTETFSRIIDPQDRNTCVLLGDGAGAAVLREGEDGHRILCNYLSADGSNADLLKVPAGGSRLPANQQTVEQRLHYMKMNGKETYRFAARLMVEAVTIALAKSELSEKDIDLLIPHQANIRILKSVAKKLSLPMENIMVNLDKYGNTSAASIPIALDEAIKQGKIDDGDIVVLTAFGSGLTWGATVIKW